MYKLVVVAGKLRGQEFTLEEGENILGRDSGCDIHLPVQGISKQHVTITVTGDACYIEDMGSSNGTFLNGKLITRATAKDKDKIALPDTIFQVVHVEEKKIIIKKKKAEDDDEDDEDYLTGGTPPKDLPKKVLWLFRFRFMKFFHGINEEYEWRALIGIILTVFCFTVIFLVIRPVLENNKSILLFEIAKRGAHYADEIARMNARALERKQLDKVDTKFLDSEDGVQEYRLFDLEGRIVRPMELLNEYISDPFAIETREWFLAKEGRLNLTRKKLLKGGIIGIGKIIQTFNPQTGGVEPVGLITIKFAPKSLRAEAVSSSKAYLESLITTALVAIIFFGIFYFLTLRPLEEMKVQIEDGLRGKRKTLESNYLWMELNPLRDSINTLLQRIRELNSEESEEFMEAEEDGPYVDTLGEFMRGSNGPVIVLDSEKNVARVNSEAEDLTGIRENASQGMSLLDVSREKGFAATVIELCDNSANNHGTSQEGQYELGGYDYNIFVTSLIGKDKFAKAFYISFLKEE